MLQDAYDHAARVVLTDPLSSRAHALLGSVILASGDFQNSVEEFRTSLSLKDDEALAIAGLGMVDFYENRLDSSIKGLRRAVSLDSTEPDYIFNLGQATARNERYKEAADAYERFLGHRAQNRRRSPGAHTRPDRLPPLSGESRALCMFLPGKIKPLCRSSRLMAGRS